MNIITENIRLGFLMNSPGLFSPQTFSITYHRRSLTHVHIRRIDYRHNPVIFHKFRMTCLHIYPSIKNLTHKQENTHQMINSFTGLDSLRTNITIISCWVKTGDQLCSNSSPYEVSKGVFSAKTIRQIFVVLRRLA